MLSLSRDQLKALLDARLDEFCSALADHLYGTVPQHLTALDAEANADAVESQLREFLVGVLAIDRRSWELAGNIVVDCASREWFWTHDALRQRLLNARSLSDLLVWVEMLDERLSDESDGASYG